jgi:hypothetical protein
MRFAIDAPPVPIAASNQTSESTLPNNLAFRSPDTHSFGHGYRRRRNQRARRPDFITGKRYMAHNGADPGRLRSSSHQGCRQLSPAALFRKDFARLNAMPPGRMAASEPADPATTFLSHRTDRPSVQ